MYVTVALVLSYLVIGMQLYLKIKKKKKKRNINIVGVAFGLPAESCYDFFFLVNSFISADIILYPLIHYFLIIFAFFFD